MSVNVSGTEGYAENASSLISRWQSISFVDHHKPVLHLIPDAPSRILDVGSGIGTDAATFAAMGHSVVAIEPVDELRVAARNLHPACAVEWLDDSLPDLATLVSRRATFDVVMLTAVWTHLDVEQRRQAMPVISSLLHEGGMLIMSLRHGPVPEGRRMFDVSAEETIRLANVQNLRSMFECRTPSVQQANRNIGVSWTRLAFKKGR